MTLREARKRVSAWQEAWLSRLESAVGNERELARLVVRIGQDCPFVPTEMRIKRSGYLGERTRPTFIDRRHSLHIQAWYSVNSEACWLLAAARASKSSPAVRRRYAAMWGKG